LERDRRSSSPAPIEDSPQAPRVAEEDLEVINDDRDLVRHVLEIISLAKKLNVILKKDDALLAERQVIIRMIRDFILVPTPVAERVVLDQLLLLRAKRQQQLFPTRVRTDTLP
jgi:hypothetical protein